MARPSLPPRALGARVACLVALALAAGASRAQEGPVDGATGRALRTLGSLVSPGALADAHAQLGGLTDCTSCHTALGGTPDPLCVECHELAGERREARRGVHGAFVGACADCHVEHRGRDADLVGLDRTTFHHDRTLFPLRGAHADAECEACHESAHPETGRVAFRTMGLAFERCASCHEDVHGEAFVGGRDCGVCHTDAGFGAGSLRDASGETRSFDHARDTSFPLEGRHARVACADCHEPWEPDARPGAAAPVQCAGCHEDPHDGALGDRCGECHTPAAWGGGEAPFDHAHHTGFPLDALHGRLDCAACHADLRFAARGTECADCHEDAASLMAGRFEDAVHDPDPHQGRIDCRGCHPAEQASARLLDHERSCVRCHDASYGPLLVTNKRALDEQVVEIEAELLRRDLAARRGEAAPVAASDAVDERVRRLARSGLHHGEFAELLLRRERAALRDAPPAVQVPDRADP